MTTRLPNTLNFVVSLPERTDRRERVRRQFDEVGIEFEFVDAIRTGSGDRLSGMCRSVIKILREALPGHIAIFEDDILIKDSFKSRFASVRVPDDWRMIYLGGSTRCDVGNGKKLKIRAERVAPNVYRTFETMHTEACVYHADAREEIAELLEACEEPFDFALTAYQKRTRRVYAILPALFCQVGGLSDRTGRIEPESTDLFTYSDELLAMPILLNRGVIS